MAAPKTGPTAKKLPGDRLGHRSQAENSRMDVIMVGDEQVAFKDAPASLAPNPEWHPVAKAGWDTFCQSPLIRNYEATDYVHAWVTCELISTCLKDGMSAGRAKELRMYMNDLGFTEGARRAMDIAIQRGAPEVDPKMVASLDRMRERKTGSA